MSDEFEEIILRINALDEVDPSFPLQNAVAAFLFIVMPIDGQSHPKEYERLMRILSDDFDLSDEDTSVLIKRAQGHKLDQESMMATADILKAGFSKHELLTLVSHMWEMVFADGRMHETEIALVERVASLLNIPQEDVAKAMTH